MAVHINGIFEKTINEKIRNCKILVVGAGGIGCELLKNLVTTGFEILSVIDLDTIELSNLNRQFLFHKQHIGKPKAVVAKESVLKFNPKAQITAYHDSILNPKYDVEFFRQFTVVTNALDNTAARSHVNRMCLAADIPLVESGTSGYYGQATTYKKGHSECYECIPRKGQKTYPGCTIRNTPSEPVHCIVWAKHLFNQLFGETDIDEEVSPDAADPEINKTMTNDGNVQRKSTREWVKEHDYDPIKIFDKLFKDDINYLNTMEDLWVKRKRPNALNFDKVFDIVPGVSIQSETQIKDQKIWSLKHCRDIFCKSVTALKESLKSAPNNILTWDKDDDVAMDFVASVANLRAACFSIEQKSRFDVKAIAGNIIPAIATSNAVIAGLIVLQLINIIKEDYSKCRNTYLNDLPVRKKLIGSGRLETANENCFVCSSKTPEVSINLDWNTLTLKTLNDKILKEKLHMAQPDVMMTDDSLGKILISSEPDENEPDELNEKFMESTLAKFGVKLGSRLLCEDFMQHYSIKLVICQNTELRDQEFEMVSDIEELLAKDKSEKPGDKKTENTSETADDDDDLEMLFDDVVENATNAPPVVLPPSNSDNGQTVIELEEEDNGQTVIELEDDDDDDCVIEVSDNKRKLSDDENGIEILPSKKQKLDVDIK